MSRENPFDLAAFLKEQAHRIDAALDREMPPADTRPAVLHQAMRYAVFTGGKRLRPALCLAACRACSGRDEAALLPALALELFHTYTLIHDDLPCMDNDAIRRGRPTVHVAFGEANALLAGDALQALAFEWTARAAAPAPYPANQLVLELAAAAGSRGVVGGQVEDLAVTGNLPDAATTDFIHRHKTADLFRAALRIGAIAAGATEDALAALTRYGVAIGIAFQITDDLLDEPAAPGGPAPFSCVSVYGEAGARQRAEEAVAEARAALRPLQPDAVKPLAAMADWILQRTI